MKIYRFNRSVIWEIVSMLKCYPATLVNRKKKEVSRILLINNGSMGDWIVFIPTCRAIIKMYPDAEIVAATATGIGGITAEEILNIGKIINFGKLMREHHAGLWPEKESVTEVKNFFRSNPCDISIAHIGSAGPLFEVISAWSGAYKRIGFCRKGRPTLLTYPIEADMTINMVDLDFRLAQVFGVKGSPLDFIGEERNENDNYILLHVRGKETSSEEKMLPVDFWTELISRLPEKFNIKVIGPVSEEEEVFINELQSKISGRIDIVEVKNQFGKLVSLMRNCSFFIGCDSGPMHLAWLFKKPGVIFGRTGTFREKEWGPYPTDSERLITHHIDIGDREYNTAFELAVKQVAVYI